MLGIPYSMVFLEQQIFKTIEALKKRRSERVYPLVHIERFGELKKNVPLEKLQRYQCCKVASALFVKSHSPEIRKERTDV